MKTIFGKILSGYCEIISLPIHKNEDLKKGLQKKLMLIAEIAENEL